MKISVATTDKLLTTSAKKKIIKIEVTAHGKNALRKIRSSIDKAAEPSITKVAIHYLNLYD